MNRQFVSLGLLALLLLNLTQPALAQESTPITDRSKSIRFDDGVVEGLGTSSGGSGALITKTNEKRRNHIYDNFISFTAEREEALREFGLSP